MSNKMQEVGSVVVNLIVIDVEVYQRHRTVSGDNLAKPIWFIAECNPGKNSWVLVSDEAQATLEARYQADFHPAPEPITDEEREEAKCEDASSSDYENTFYAQ
jgi:hypothetical protein|tara:strand:+ start:158 stop:466 length:309 start_codon:yes stop_codon:yes gene_type:complete